MIKNILNNLHPAINKDPQAVPALVVTNNGYTAGSITFFISDNNALQVYSDNISRRYDLGSYTLGSLASAMTTDFSSLSATSVGSSALSALVLMPSTFSIPSVGSSFTINMFTSFLWQVLKPVAVALVSALNAENNALLEMILNSADGAWLDSFGELFGVAREAGEPDQLYAIRIFDLSVGTRVNNMAIQKALLDIQYPATVTDGSGATFNVSITMPTSPPQGFVYSTAQMRDIIDQLRPAGVSYTIISTGNLADSFSVGDSYTILTSTSSTKYGTGRKWGQGVWAK